MDPLPTYCEIKLCLHNLFRLKTKGPGGHLHCSRLHIKYNKIYSSMQQYIVHKTTTECNMHEAISTLF